MPVICIYSHVAIPFASGLGLLVESKKLPDIDSPASEVLRLTSAEMRFRFCCITLDSESLRLVSGVCTRFAR